MDMIPQKDNLEKEENYEKELSDFLKLIKDQYTKIPDDPSFPAFTGPLKAVCINNYDHWLNTKVTLEIGKEYEVEYALIGRSWTMISLKDFPNQVFNSVLLNFYENNNPFSIINDFLKIKESLKVHLRPTTTLVLYDIISEIRLKEILSANKNIPVINRVECQVYYSKS